MTTPFDLIPHITEFPIGGTESIVVDDPDYRSPFADTNAHNYLTGDGTAQLTPVFTNQMSFALRIANPGQMVGDARCAGQAVGAAGIFDLLLHAVDSAPLGYGPDRYGYHLRYGGVPPFGNGQFILGRMDGSGISETFIATGATALGPNAIMGVCTIGDQVQVWKNTNPTVDPGTLEPDPASWAMLATVTDNTYRNGCIGIATVGVQSVLQQFWGGTAAGGATPPTRTGVYVNPRRAPLSQHA